MGLMCIIITVPHVHTQKMSRIVQGHGKSKIKYLNNSHKLIAK